MDFTDGELNNYDPTHVSCLQGQLTEGWQAAAGVTALMPSLSAGEQTQRHRPSPLHLSSSGDGLLRLLIPQELM